MQVHLFDLLPPEHQRLPPTPAIGSISLGSLFRTLPTRALTGQPVISSAG
jgi:hypothetical protein